MSNTVLPLIPLRPAPPPAPPCGAPAVPELPPRDALASAVRELKSRLDAIVVAKADLVNGKVPAGQLPSYVDDVVEVAALPSSGESGKLYVVTGTNAVYRWSGSSFVEVSPSRDWSGELARKQDVIPDLEAIRSKANSALQAHQDISGKRDLTDLSVDRGKWLLVKPDGTQARLEKSDPQRDAWTGDGFTLSFGEEGGDPFWFLWKTDSSGGFVIDESVSSPPDANKLEFTDGVSVYRLVRGSRLALDTEIPVVDDAVTRTSANPVKSSGIWSAIWGALTALPSGFSSLYDWVVAQLAGKLNTDGYTSWRISYPVSGYELLSCRWNRRGFEGEWVVELLNVASGEKETFNVPGAKTITEIVGPSEDPMHPLFRLVREKMCKTKTSELTNDGDGDSPFATVSQIPDISGKADAADLRYRIAEAEYSASVGTAGGYIVADRTVNLIAATDETSIDIELPAAVTVGAVRYARDFLLDVDNSANASDLALEFTALGVNYGFVTDADDDIGEMMTIVGYGTGSSGDGARVRLYFTECAVEGASGQVLFHVARVTLSADIDSTTQGGN